MEDYIKISELEPTTDLEGLYTIGSDKNNLSKKVALQFLKDAANYANEQGDYAKQVGDTVNGNVGVSDYPEFSASTSYVIGDVVRYNGALYIFTANHAASAWNGNDVKATSINAITSGKLTELESEINTKVYSESSFILKEDAAHSSQNDKAFISINEGETFYTRIRMENGSYSQIFAYYADGTSENIQDLSPVPNVTYQFVASKDIVAISMFAVAGTGKIWFRVWKDDSIEQDIQNIEQEIQNLGFDTHVLKFKPQNDTLTKIRLLHPYLKKGRKYRLTFVNPNWDISGVTTLHTVFSIGYVPKDKTEAEYVALVRVNVPELSTQLQQSYDVDVTDDWEFLNIEMRCSEWVYIICEDITEVDKIASQVDILNNFKTEAGFDAQVLKFEPLNDTLTKRQLFAPLVCKGTRYRITILNPNWDMSGVTSTGNGFSIGYRPKDGREWDYVRLVQVLVSEMQTLQSSYIIDVTDDWDMLNIELRASEMVYIKVEDITGVQAVNDKAESLESTIDFDIHMLKFKPQNNTLTKVRLYQPHLKKGRKYRLTLTNPSWDISGVTLTEAYVFGFGYVPKGKTEADYVRLVSIPLALMSTIQPSYEFEVTDDWEFFNVELRSSEMVYIICEDITEVTALKNELLGAEGFVSKNDLVLNTYAGQYNSANVKDKAKEFCSLLDTDGAVEPFVFFTDTHLYHWNVSEQKRIEALNLIRKYYNSIPANFILCGGDWLTNHKKADALHYLGEIDGIMHKTFDNYYSVFGNHDNNYQGGILNEVRSEGDEGIISNDTMANLWFREYGKMYYYFHGTSTRFFVLDTGIDWESGMTAYRWEQIDWLANLLLTQPSEHNAIAMHIMSLSADFEQGITPMADAVTKLANAYNTRSSITLNGKTYDFASSEGKVHVAICGHSHYDWAGQINGLPTLCTTQFLEGYTGTETFDMIILDYAANKLRTIRVGVGSNRELDM